MKSVIFNEHLVAVVGTTVRNVGYQGRNTGYQDYCLDCIAHACQKVKIPISLNSQEISP